MVFKHLRVVQFHVSMWVVLMWFFSWRKMTISITFFSLAVKYNGHLALSLLSQSSPYALLSYHQQQSIHTTGHLSYFSHPQYFLPFTHFFKKTFLFWFLVSTSVFHRRFYWRSIMRMTSLRNILSLPPILFFRQYGITNAYITHFWFSVWFVKYFFFVENRGGM